MCNMTLFHSLINQVFKMDYKKIDSNTRKNLFFNQLQLSQVTINNYRSALNGRFINGIVREINKKYNCIFDISDLSILWDLYCKINLHPTNIANHRGYSCALMQYIRFLNGGKKIGQRIDANTKRKKIIVIKKDLYNETN